MRLNLAEYYNINRTDKVGVGVKIGSALAKNYSSNKLVQVM